MAIKRILIDEYRGKDEHGRKLWIFYYSDGTTEELAL